MRKLKIQAIHFRKKIDTFQDFLSLLTTKFRKRENRLRLRTILFNELLAMNIYYTF